MVAEVRPAQLAQVLDAAERPRAQNWSLRAALTRYGQPQPQRASAVIELLRRTDGAIRPHTKLLEQEGDAVWQAVQAPGEPQAVDASVVELLRAIVDLDTLGDALAEWAVDRAGERPDALVDAVVAEVTARLEGLGIQRDERPRPTGRRA